MAIRVLLYCLKVWVSALVIGTLLFIAIIYVFSQAHPLQSDLTFAVYLFVYGFCYSIPSLLISWVGAYFINNTSRSRKVKCMWIALLGAPVTLLPFVIFQGGFSLDWQPICLIAGLYYAVSAAAIFFYPLPEAHPQHV